MDEQRTARSEIVFRSYRVAQEPRVCSRDLHLTSAFPKQEAFGLSQQSRRAAVSVPANIAEGFKRRSRKEKARFLNIAEGSVAECRYYLLLARDLGYGNTAELMTLLEEVSRMLTSYSLAIRTSEFRVRE